jgi:NAD+ kinase
MRRSEEISTIGITYNKGIAKAESISIEVERWLTSRQETPWRCSTSQTDEIRELLAGCRLLIVLGGDGTTLLAARIAARDQIPIFGINMGRVGFLSEATTEDWPIKLGRVLAGECWLEKRLMLHAEVKRGDEKLGSMDALNDVVVSRGAQVRVVRFHLYVDGYHVTTYTADGLIAATPTGSTAYSMAAGGPLLPPQLKNYLVLPVAPHLSFERPLVVHQEAEIKIQVETHHGAFATADGQDAISLVDGDEVVIGTHHLESTFARVDGPGYFYLRLMQRLSFWSRKV